MSKNCVHPCLEDARRWSLQELQAHTGIDQATVHKKIWCRYETCRIHLERYQNEGENLLNNIIAIDETWVRTYEPELKRQSAEWRHEGSSRRQKFH